MVCSDLCFLSGQARCLGSSFMSRSSFAIRNLFPGSQGNGYEKKIVPNFQHNRHNLSDPGLENISLPWIMSSECPFFFTVDSQWGLVKLARDLTRPHTPRKGSFLEGKWDPGYFREI